MEFADVRQGLGQDLGLVARGDMRNIGKLVRRQSGSRGSVFMVSVVAAS
ncbi:hypothetical protein PEC18_14360 [Paucibacter sp. O1-1]|nr:hypothetical protein [Paucibacter sp. M5-1]MCU7372008.1 hypothetical protein [Paucibacter sp. O1-1]MCZ7880793.1 hypothetical protein [Paucibacter sp. M5-1]MDA3826999.1 hypothetical protein [Paucibacter sp. O1-1]